MLLKKFQLSIIALLTVFFVLQSCEKKPLKITKKQHSKAEIDRLIAVAHKYFEKGKYDSSYYYFDKAKKEAIIKKDTSRTIHSLSFMAQSKLNQGDYANCEAMAIRALPFLKNAKKYPYATWYLYNALGTNYMYKFEYKNSLYYFNKGLKLKTDNFRKGSSKNNIALVYIEKQDYQKAIELLLPLISIKEVINEPELYSTVLSNLGLCYFRTGNPKALDYLNKGLKIREERGIDFEILGSYLYLAEFYLKKNPDLAFKYSLIAYEKATKIKDNNDRLISLTSLIKSSKGDESKKYALDYIRINDSNIKAKQIAKNQFAKMKYDSKNEKEENQKLKIDKIQNEILLEQQKNRVLLLFYFITTGIIATLGIVKYLNSKNKTDKIKTTIETENRISKKLHDEVANDLFQMINFAETRDLESKGNKDILLSNLGNIYCATRNISRENSSLVKGEEFEKEIKELLSSFNSTTINILSNGLEKIDWKTLDIIKKIIVYRVLQELLVNMKKHSNCSLVMLIFKKNKNNLEINYSDNGAGAPIDEIIKGKGLQNVRNRILDVKGNITFESEPNKGFKSSIVLPL